MGLSIVCRHVYYSKYSLIKLIAIGDRLDICFIIKLSIRVEIPSVFELIIEGHQKT